MAWALGVAYNGGPTGCFPGLVGQMGTDLPMGIHTGHPETLVCEKQCCTTSD